MRPTNFVPGPKSLLCSQGERRHREVEQLMPGHTADDPVLESKSAACQAQGPSASRSPVTGQHVTMHGRPASAWEWPSNPAPMVGPRSMPGLLGTWHRPFWWPALQPPPGEQPGSTDGSRGAETVSRTGGTLEIGPIGSFFL
jgi:hypothetical protein